MEIKSHEFGRALEKLIGSSRLFVIYGPDRGLVSERAKAISARTGVSADDPFSSVRLDGADLQSDQGRLIDEMNSIGLFGGSRAVRIRATGTEKALVESVQYLSEHYRGDTFLIIEAGDLKKGTGLRKIADTSRSIISVACYADDTRSLNSLIDTELEGQGLGIGSAARQLLVELLGGDRLASRNEIQKLALYCKGQQTIEESDVIDIIGDASATSTDDAVDCVLSGDRTGFLHAVRKITTSKTPIFLILQACLRQFQMMDLMRAEMDEKGLPSAQIMLTLGRHIHFRRKPVIEKALNVWTAPRIANEMNRLQSAVLLSRQRPLLEESIALQTLMAITLQSGAKSR